MPERVMTTRGQQLLDQYPLFLRKDQTLQAICNAAGPELDLLDIALDRLERNLIPATASEHLDFYEAQLGLAVANPAMSLSERTEAVLVALSRAVMTGQGIDWETIAAQILGVAFTYIVGAPNNSHLTVVIPYASGTIQATLAEALLRSITPATMTLNVTNAAKFLLDDSLLDDALMG